MNYLLDVNLDMLCSHIKFYETKVILYGLCKKDKNYSREKIFWSTKNYLFYILPLFWNTLHSRTKICSKILYILVFSQQKYGKLSGPSLSIGYHYFQCSLDWLFTNLSSTNKCTTNLSDFFLKCRIKENGGSKSHKKVIFSKIFYRR
jgi:hypothetical protein